LVFNKDFTLNPDVASVRDKKIYFAVTPEPDVLAQGA
jgi:hypothetical protein